ncbi:MAG: transglycosylase SLT domain-containing protein [Alphaproteobacteria bacterium]|nr:transglycosylase SLT domain-containing protein [Alphaproteobacteria bacterium]
MQGHANSFVNNALATLTRRAPTGVMNAIKQASAKTGVNFAYMVQQAGAESSFNPTAKAKSSSASGLYQFIESTWMNMVKTYGAKHGIETDGMSRKEILALRNDPVASANMAAEFASENERFLRSHWGGEIGPTELYFAHFMGAGGASAFLKARDDNPLQEAAVLFPKAAKANRNVFYDVKSGRAKSMEEVYAFFDKKFSIKDAPQPDYTQETQYAAAAPLPQIKPDLGNETMPSHPGQIAQLGFGASEPSTPAPYAPSSVYSAAKTARVSGDSFIRSYAPAPYHALLQNPIELMLLTQLDVPGVYSPGKKS